jgi:hypothetical protein
MMASTTHIRQWKLSQWSGLLEDFVAERSAPKSDRRITDGGRHRRAVVLGHHGAPQLTRWLKVASEHAAILVARGGDGWPARRRQFGLRCHTAE